MDFEIVSLVNLPSLIDRVLQITGKFDTLQDLTNDNGNIHKIEMEEKGCNGTIGEGSTISNNFLKN